MSKARKHTTSAAFLAVVGLLNGLRRYLTTVASASTGGMVRLGRKWLPLAGAAALAGLLQFGPITVHDAIASVSDFTKVLEDLMERVTAATNTVIGAVQGAPSTLQVNSGGGAE